MLALGWLAYCAFGMAVGSLAPLVSPIMRDLGLSSARMGLVLGVWQLAYVFTGIPLGVAVDRLGVRRAVAAGGVLLLWTLCYRAPPPGGVGARPAPPARVRGRWLVLLRERNMRLLLVLALGTFVVNHGPNAWQPTYLEEAGFLLAAAGSSTWCAACWPPAEAHGAGRRYLIQHSAARGKSNSWSRASCCRTPATSRLPPRPRTRPWRSSARRTRSRTGR